MGITAHLATSTASSSVWIGCSGWQYRHWRGVFYPASLASSRWLEFYAERFDTVEINNTFYRLPEAETFVGWRKRSPPRFVYAVKASRFLTHMKKLKDPKEPLERFFSRASQLGRALGPVLYQLPPRFPVNVERLSTFVRALPKRRRHAIEFRDPSWYTTEVLELLKTRGVALCYHDMAGSAVSPFDDRTGGTGGTGATGGFVYVRFHGTAKYSGSYNDETIERWAKWLAERVRDGVQVYAYFNNDTGGHAPHDAVRLREAVLRYL